MQAKQELNLFFITKKIAYIINEITKSDALDYISNNSKVIVVIIIFVLIVDEIIKPMKPYVLFLIILII